MSRAERPEWCGRCDEDTRLVELDDGTAGRCLTCHASTQPGHRHDPAQLRRRGTLAPTCPGCGQPVYRTHRCRASALISGGNVA